MIEPLLYCTSCPWTGYARELADGIHGRDVQIVMSDGGVVKKGDPAKVCPKCGSEVAEIYQP